MTKYDFSAHYYFAKDITNKLPKKDDLVFGAIIGTVEIIGYTLNRDSSQWFAGFYGFQLLNPRPLIEPIMCKGALGFWNVPSDIETKIKQSLK